MNKIHYDDFKVQQFEFPTPNLSDIFRLEISH